MVPFQPPINRPRPIPMQPQPQMNTGWRDVYTPFRQDQQRLSLPGFYISSLQDITPRDVPMDGSISFFPSNDLSYIIIKQWTGNGTIAEARYILEPPANQQQVQPQIETEQKTESTETTPAEPGNSEIVEVISTALNEQTQRLTAAFSQIGVAFNTLQQKLDSFMTVPFTPLPVEQLAEDFQETGLKNPEPVERQKTTNRPKNKEPKENEKV